ncbi:copper chaperone PCu(A)C [Nitratireductor kimnyeongensis]|uniref:Copper chaperone PCu(A)C n=1 Tax=Nitratireductor kimnyeongensis TaxID=430679 RepID=A0ABW0TBV8_9HYPH|nr:copper chaperone PCu(A)C [Nitratireductor kimnyeongensis]QZZ37718.1 copper chaperone PCu(A)C [Nitratireductor kimnyeongensis]
MRFMTRIFAAALLFTAAPAFAGDYTLGKMEIDQPWTRATPPGAKAAGGFVTIMNDGEEDDQLIGAKAGFAGRVELHTMDMTDGVMKMRHLPDGIPVPAGETVSLAPGGLHIMFMDLRESLAEGGPVPVSLTFEKAGTIEVEMSVAKPGAPAPDGHTHMHDESTN